MHHYDYSLSIFNLGIKKRCVFCKIEEPIMKEHHHDIAFCLLQSKFKLLEVITKHMPAYFYLSTQLHKPYGGQSVLLSHIFLKTSELGENPVGERYTRIKKTFFNIFRKTGSFFIVPFTEKKRTIHFRVLLVKKRVLLKE